MNFSTEGLFSKLGRLLEPVGEFWLQTVHEAHVHHLHGSCSLTQQADFDVQTAALPLLHLGGLLSLCYPRCGEEKNVLLSRACRISSPFLGFSEPEENKTPSGSHSHIHTCTGAAASKAQGL